MLYFVAFLTFLLLPFAPLVIAFYMRRRTLALEDVVTRLSARVEALERRGRATAERAETAEPKAFSAPSPEPTVFSPEPRIASARSAVSAVAFPQPVAEPKVSSASSADATVVLPSLEARIGSRWMLYVGVVAVVVGVGYFEKLAIDNQWISPTARVLQGAVVGALLVAGGLRLARAGYEFYGQILSGGGVAVLYVSTFAAGAYYRLIGPPTAFVLMCAVTALAAALADRQRSQGLAIMAVGGGFLTPFLLPTNRSAYVGLFTYDTILIGGTMYLAHRREWPALNLVSYLFTGFTVLAWGATSFTRDKYLTVEMFLTVFCVMYLDVLRQLRHTTQPLAALARAALWTAPVGYYILYNAILFPHSLALLVFLIAVAVIGALVGIRTAPAARLVFLIASILPLFAWVVTHETSAWLVGGLAAIAGIYLINLAADLEGLSTTEDAEEWRSSVVRTALLHINALAAFGIAYVLIDAVRISATAPTAAAFAGWHGALAFWLSKQRRDAALHFLALAATFAAVAIALQFDGAVAIVGWTAEGAALVWLGLREGRSWIRAGGALLAAIAILALLDLQSSSLRVGQVALVNTRAASGAFVVALLYLVAWLHRRRDAAGHAQAIVVAIIAAQVLTLSLLSSEITGYFNLRGFNRTGYLAWHLALSLTWALFATVLIVAGIRAQYAPIRYFAITVLAVTSAKVFFIDLAAMDRIYRVGSMIGVGVLLLISSYLYTRFSSHISARRAPL